MGDGFELRKAQFDDLGQGIEDHRRLDVIEAEPQHRVPRLVKHPPDQDGPDDEKRLAGVVV